MGWSSRQIVLVLLLTVGRVAAAAEPDAAHRILIATWAQRVVKVSGKIKRVTVNAELFDAKPISANELLLLGVHEGQGTLLVWLQGNRRESFLVTVVKRDPTADADEKNLLMGDSSRVEIIDGTPHMNGDRLSPEDTAKLERVLEGFPKPSTLLETVKAELKGIEGLSARLIGSDVFVEGCASHAETSNKIVSLLTRFPEVHHLEGCPYRLSSPNEKLHVRKGQIRMLLTDGTIKRVAVGNDAILDVRTTGTSELVILGVAEGTTTLVIWLQGRKRESYVVTVRPADAPGLLAYVKAELADVEGITVRIAEERVLLQGCAATIEGDSKVRALLQRLPSQMNDLRSCPTRQQVNAEDRPPSIVVELGRQKVLEYADDISRIEIADRQIAEASVREHRRFIVLGTALGKTKLTLWTSDGTQRVYPIFVRTPVPPEVQKELDQLCAQVHSMGVTVHVVDGTVFTLGLLPDLEADAAQVRRLIAKIEKLAKASMHKE